MNALVSHPVARFLARRIAYSLVVLTGVTHWIPTQAPAAAAEAVLDRVASLG